MYAVLLSCPPLAKCSTSKAKAPSSAARLPPCLSSRSCSSIAMLPRVPVNVPETIVHGERPLPMSKVSLCLDGRAELRQEAFQ